ncbi:MAG: YbaB/EbfC family nucleoid-associated protein [Verrucomicrobiales bacterium]
MNLNKLLQQAQSMQANMQAAQEKLADTEIEASGANGKIKATANGTGELTALEIDPSLFDPEDAEFLTDLILKTVQEALGKAKEAAADEMKKHTGGLGIPGM